MTTRTNRTIFTAAFITGAILVVLGLTSLYHLGVANAQVPAMSPAPSSSVAAPPDIDGDPEGFFRYGYDAATSGRWKVFAGVVLLGVAWGIRKSPLGTRVPWFKTRLGGFTLAFALALAGTYGLAFATGAPINPLLALDAFVTTGLAAGLWQWLQIQLEKRGGEA